MVCTRDGVRPPKGGLLPSACKMNRRFLVWPLVSPPGGPSIMQCS